MNLVGNKKLVGGVAIIVGLGAIWWGYGCIKKG
jgi:hypothetical protein